VLDHARARRAAAHALICAVAVLAAVAAPAAAAAVRLDAGPATARAAATPPEAGGTQAAVARATAACRDAGARLLCLVNATRTRAGLRRLRPDRRLARAAAAQARDMARRHYFAHQRPGGPTLLARVRAAGFHGSSAGEAIAWGCGRLGGAAATLQAWLASPPHRAILLSPGYTRAGVGAARGAPIACAGGTYRVLDAGAA
jgi:uncharacterized protein YkwD